MQKIEMITRKYEYDYLVCFLPKEKGTSFLGKIFGHVVLWRNVNAMFSIRIEPTLEGVFVIPYNKNVNDFIPSLEKEYRTYVWRTNIKNFTTRNYFPEIFSCVSLAKRLLGINKWWIITPKQLEKYIVKHE